MKKTKLEKGITLIALIITIVVLLILAVVAIGAVKESGIITYAQKAATDYNSAKADEESKIEGYEALIESKLPGEKSEESTVTYTDEGVPVPAGFKVVTGTKDTGLVIENETEGSQFVWVPIIEDIDPNGYGLNTSNYREPDVITGVTPPSETVDSASGTSYDAVSSNLERAGCTEDLNDDGAVNAYDFKIQLTKEYKEMTESVNKYDGFYVGRYETSKNGENPQSKASTEENVIETAYNSSIENDWYGLYALNKKYSTSSVQGSMIWGSQYDAMMKWMGDAANTNKSDYNHNRTCGTAPNDLLNNVYDLYGNSYEWTLEAGPYGHRSYRGGWNENRR